MRAAPKAKDAALVAIVLRATHRSLSLQPGYRCARTPQGQQCACEPQHRIDAPEGGPSFECVQHTQPLSDVPAELVHKRMVSNMLAGAAHGRGAHVAVIMAVRSLWKVSMFSLETISLPTTTCSVHQRHLRRSL